MGGEMAEIAAGIVGGAINGITNIANASYNAWANQRDFDYQRAIQNITWAREDTAVQRRMADLKAAGLNPNLAAGSAASSGAVVGRSNTGSLGLNGNAIGVALDTASAVQQLRAQREQNQILKNQKRESQAKAQLAANDAILSNIETNAMLGLRSTLKYLDDERGYQVQYSFPESNSKVLTRDNSLLMNILKFQYDNQKNAADLLQKDVDYYTADKIAEYFGAGVSAFSGIGSGYRSFRFRR